MPLIKRLLTSGVGAMGVIFILPTSADVAALGRLEPENGVMRVAAPVTPETGMGVVLAELMVAPGDDVEKGQLLAVSESAALLDAMVEEARAEYAFAGLEADAAQAEAEAACVLADVQQREAERRSRLTRQSLYSEEDTQRAFANAESQQASCEAFRVAASAARSRVNLVQARVDRRVSASERARIRAPTSGRILRVVTWPGEYIGQQGILELGTVDRMFAVAEVYETEIRQVQPGQRAQITSDALGEPLSGTVEHIRPMVRKQDVTGTDPAARKDARIVEVEILLDEASAVSDLSNLQVEVVIRTSSS